MIAVRLIVGHGSILEVYVSTAAGHGQSLATGCARWLFPVEDSDSDGFS